MPRTEQIWLQYLLWFNNYNYLNLEVHITTSN